VANSASPIKTVIIICKENHTYDNYFGTFPGGNGDATLPQAPNPPKSDPSQHTHVSLVKFCEVTFGLSSINARDAASDGMEDCLDFTQPPNPTPPSASARSKPSHKGDVTARWL
jgi:Phosphoesterase family